MKFDTNYENTYKRVNVSYVTHHELQHAMWYGMAAYQLMAATKALHGYIVGALDEYNFYTIAFTKRTPLDIGRTIIENNNSFLYALDTFKNQRTARSQKKEHRRRRSWSENDLNALDIARKLRNALKTKDVDIQNYYTEILAYWSVNNDVMQIILTLDKDDIEKFPF